ncbi:MAG: molybdopterin-dependent oxidoreductase [Candidatus Aminicenantales bacterium]|jgi:DMSO/TMAO reductase YedYZ molybdopterin-dependent catalytic subunit
MKTNLKYVAVSFALVLALSPAGAREKQERKDHQVQSVEIKEYRGEKLDPIEKFEENSIKGPQHVDIRKYSLKIGGLVDKPVSYSYEQVLSHKAESKVTIIHCVEGWDVKILWEGVPIAELLGEAGPKPTANTVIFKSADGYSTSLPLDYITKKNILLAYKMNGLILPEERGFPFQVVAEDKWGYKWAKWVTAVELTNDPSYKGYWESRGYNNGGDHSGPIFEKKK